MNRWIKWIGIIILIPVVLFILLASLLYIPAVQNFAKNKATAYASKVTGMDIRIDRVRLSFPLNIVIKEVEVVDAHADTLLHAGGISASVQLKPLFKKEVVINGIDIQDVSLDTDSLIKGMHVGGTLGSLTLKADRALLTEEQVTINDIGLHDADIRLVLASDTTPKVQDTIQSSVRWKMKLQSVTLDKVAFAMKMPQDSMYLAARIQEAKMRDGNIDLYTQRYEASLLSITNSSLTYIQGDTVPLPGFDPSYIVLNDLNMELDSVMNQKINVAGFIRELSFKERSGLQVSSLTGKVRMDSTQVYVPDLTLATPYSNVKLQAQGAVTSFRKDAEGQLKVLLSASLGKRDIVLLAGQIPESFQQNYPDKPISVQVNIDGNTDKLYIRTLDARLPDAFKLTANGTAEQIMDSLRRSGEIKLKLETENLEFVTAMLDSTGKQTFRLPSNMLLEGDATLAAGLYHAQLNLTEGKGNVDLTAYYQAFKKAYGADVDIRNLQLANFLPSDSLQHISATLHAEGQGTDFFAPATFATLKGRINRLEYGSLDLTGVTLDGSLKQHKAQVTLNSDFAPARFNLNVEGTLQRNHVAGEVTLQVDTLNLYQLHLMKSPFTTSLLLHFTGESDLKKNFQAEANLTQWKIITPRQTVSPKDILVKASSAAHATELNLQAGDLSVEVSGNEDVQTLSTRFSRFSAMLAEQMKKEVLNLTELREQLPVLQMQVSAGSDNPVHNFLGLSNINFRTMSFRASTSPADGLNGNLLFNSFQLDTLQLDTVRLALHQDDAGIHIDAGISNNEQNRQHVFTSSLEGLVENTGAQALLRFVNGQGKTGLMLGARVKREENAWVASFYPDDPIVAFRRFHLIENNYIRMNNDKKIDAHFRMEGEDGAVLSFNSRPSDAKQNILDLGIQKFNLSLISQLLPYMPDVGGLLHANVEYAVRDSIYHVKADLGVDTLSYERRSLGDIQLDASYMPGTGKSHHIDAHLLHNKSEVLAATGAYYQMGNQDSLQSRIKITDLPLWMANPFIPEDMANMAGALEGQMEVTGHMKQPDINGYVNLDTASVFVVPAGARFRFDDKRIEIKDNRFLFNQYHIISSGNNPFTIDGVVDASDFANMTADLTLSANNMEVLNVKRNKESLVYGKVYIDLNSTVKGPFDALVMRGNIELLGNTNATYVLKDSPLTVQDRLSDIVTFVNFADTAQLQKAEEQPLKLGGLDMLLTIHIDQAVQLNVDLSEDRQSYVNAEGGGDLSFQYSPQGDMVLTGRYTISSGKVRYALPVIPAKTFSIQQGSYVEWSGNAMDPYIDVTAIERVRTSVTLPDQAPQPVNFDVSIAVKNTLENLSLQFNLSAPENMAVENELSAMSAEERSKQAVAMLVTNMYMAGGNSSGKTNLNVGDALNSFLQKEIGNLAGGALKSIDVTFGMETYDADGQQGGGSRTDYSFQFSKRFYNDRLQVIIGGRISTGVPEEETQSFIDNVAIEYRLDNSGSRYIKLFHNKDYESILEGEITETGAGIVLRRKMQRLKELFLFKRKKQETQSSTL
ncbi:translocation/assembly module TamB domain-containing protein [Parabacteroides pacaensis]|uniref:translocation/assembly module TamB domain-containing protein n=1 Tax=Parabacteroides pacaensis TaxID=2086575 RepID=UPI000D0F845A|nr:translocation/assembly module TamB domain-containing protein [Parabacteroides pacaensis]